MKAEIRFDGHPVGVRVDLDTMTLHCTQCQADFNVTPETIPGVIHDWNAHQRGHSELPQRGLVEFVQD